MAVTTEEKNRYHEMIQTVFDGTVYSSPSQVTDRVADVMDQVIDAIYNCSKDLAIVRGLWEFWMPGGSFRQLAETARDAVITALQEVAKVQNGQQYSVCINATRLNWRSTLQLALMGI